MKARIIALTGISGVGKSTLVESLTTSLPLEHLQAGLSIMEGRDAIGNSSRHDQLRLADIDENQRYLVEGLRRRAGACVGLVVLDGHTVIEKDEELILIDPAVFRAMSIKGMIFLEDDPAAIAERRRHDASRNRPLPSVERLRRVQDAAREQAVAICWELGVPLHVFRPDEFAAVAAILGQGSQGT